MPETSEFVSLVNGKTPEPSLFISQRFVLSFVSTASLPFRARLDENAIFVPSGDQTGRAVDPAALSRVKGTAPEPSSNQIFEVPFEFAVSLPSGFRAESKAI